MFEVILSEVASELGAWMESQGNIFCLVNDAHGHRIRIIFLVLLC